VGVGHNVGVAESANADDSRYTAVADAKAFIEATNVDSLAISIGTAHGLYKGTPKINFERLKEIYESVETPLVLHGGSSSGDENLHRCAVGGISKINIYTDFLVAAENAIEKNAPDNYLAVKHLARQGMEDCLRHYYSVFATKAI
jgi:fructose-bisphosphate aldolase class II